LVIVPEGCLPNFQFGQLFGSHFLFSFVPNLLPKLIGTPLFYLTIMVWGNLLGLYSILLFGFFLLIFPQELFPPYCSLLESSCFFHSPLFSLDQKELGKNSGLLPFLGMYWPDLIALFLEEPD